MTSYIRYFYHWQILIATIAKPIVFGILLLFLTKTPVNGQSQPSEELKQYNEAVKNKEYIKAAQFANDIARHYSENKAPDKALEYATQSLTYAKKAGDPTLLFPIHHQLGIYYSEAKKYTKASEHFQSALTIAQKLKDNNLIKDELINLSISYSYQEKFKKAIEFSEEGLSLAITMHDVELQQKCYRLLSDFYAKQNNVKKSEEYKTQLDLLIAAQEKEEERKRKINELEKTIEATGQEKQVTQAKLTEQSKKLLQSTASLRMTERSLRATTDYLQATTDSLKEIEAISRNRQMEIDLLQKNKELTDITIKEQEARFRNEALFRNSVLGGSLLSIALVGVLIISNRKSIKANRKIKQQNKNIKSSINYAKRIQEAMLPKSEHHPAIFKDSFILFKPRDTVSGDFYWISEITKKGQTTGDVAFAAVDCTGHGVPGALMSMIGINALNTLSNRGITESNVLLDSLDHEIRTALRQEISGINDGMDVSLCIYRQKEKVIEFSGAQSPLIYIQNSNLTQIKGDVHSIGGRKKTTEGYHFKKHRIAIDSPTVVYLFSDGYKDQFGGPENRKFLTKKLHKLLLEIHQLPMTDQMNTLQATIDAWKGEHDQTDDILVMGIRLA